jgi:hypothetical protein
MVVEIIYLLLNLHDGGRREDFSERRDHSPEILKGYAHISNDSYPQINAYRPTSAKQRDQKGSIKNEAEMGKGKALVRSNPNPNQVQGWDISPQ